MKYTPVNIRTGDTYPNVEAHFDGMAEKYEAGCEKVAWVGPERVFEQVKRFLRPNKPISLVDLGAGTGRIGGLAKSFNEETTVTGVDISGEMLKIGADMKRIDTIIEGDVTALPGVEDASADAVTSAGVLDFIKNPEAFVAEAARILKPGGVIGITFEPTETDFHGHKTLCHDESSIQTLFARHGLRVVEKLREPSIYKNFAKKDKPPVENVILVAVREPTLP